jgi:hypothetical protein
MSVISKQERETGIEKKIFGRAYPNKYSKY